MASDDVREIKSRLDIVEIVSEYVPLKKNGQTFWGRCPFHSEKTPSFSVSPERQTFHCFGCGKSGDVITFIMESEHLEFREALERLAERAGVVLSRNRGESDTRRLNIDINQTALEFFKNALISPSGEAARKYLERRDISPEVARRFEIGWAPTSWDALLNTLRKKNFNENQIIDGGLALIGRNGSCYDRFRGRVMFPIYNISGRLVGFGGRILDGDGAKYLNSPESKLFNKRHNLYLLDKAKSSIGSKGCAILVEGYMDAIRAHLFGYTNAVASLGTALTQTQASLIKRMTGLCYICYDSDEAGQEAALRAMYVLQAEGVNAKRVVWEGGKDPDELLLLPDGPALFEKAIMNASPLPVYHAKLRERALKDPLTAPAAIKDLAEGLSSLSAFELSPYIDELAGILGIFPHEVQKLLTEHREAHRKVQPLDSLNERAQFSSGTENDVCHEWADDIEYMLCSMFWNDGELRSAYSAKDIAVYISDPRIQTIIFSLLSGDSPDALERRWRQIGDNSGMTAVSRGNSLISKERIGRDAVGALIETLKSKYLKRMSQTLLTKIKDGTISENEYAAYLKYTKLLKGGNARV